MKKILYFGFVLLFFASCSSMRTFEINRIRNSEPTISSIPIESFTVLERVSGSATVSSVKRSDGTFDGDTHLYGSLDQVDAIYLNLGIGLSPNPKTPFDAALANAIYQMVEKAEALKADAVLFVRTKTDVKYNKTSQTVTVTVSGTAVKLK